MNVLKPNFVIVDGRCYRQLHSTEPVYHDDSELPSKRPPYTSSIGPSAWDTPDVYSDEPVTCSVKESGNGETDNTLAQNLDVKSKGTGYTAALNIPAAYFGVIIGRGGETMRRVQQETQSKIQVPHAGATGPVVITAATVKAIEACHSRIEVLIESAKKRFKATHFLSIPVNCENIKKSFGEFAKAVERECGIKGEVFQKPERLHFTLGMLLLNDAVEIKAATDELKKCKEEIVDPILRGQSLKVHLSGLEYMNDDPSCVNVLYAKLKPDDHSDNLQQVSDQLVQRFKSRGLLHLGQGPSSVSAQVKLHVTLMNSIFCQLPDEVSVATQQRKPADRRTAFDASRILKAFDNFDFGPMELSEIHVSKRGDYDSSSGYYKSETTISL